MIRTGMVLEINNSKAGILTNDGQFFKVWVKKKSPSIGEVYSGQVINQNMHLKFASLAASIFLLVFLGTFAGFYFTPVTTVEININPSIELKGNVFNRIIKITPLNQDGEQILKSTNLKNKSIDDALSLIVEESIEQNFINEKYISSGKTINVNIKGEKDSEVQLDNFYEKAEKEGLHVNIKGSEDNSNKGNIKIKIKNDSLNEIEIKPKKEKDQPPKDDKLKSDKKNDLEETTENRLEAPNQNKKDKQNNENKQSKKDKQNNEDKQEKDLDNSNHDKKNNSSFENKSNHKDTFKNIDNKHNDKVLERKDANPNQKNNNDSNESKDNTPTNKGNASSSKDSNGSIPDKGLKKETYITKDKEDKKPSSNPKTEKSNKHKN